MRQQLRIAECQFSSKRIKRRLKYRIVFLNSLIFHFRSIHKLSYVVSDIAGYISVRGWSYTYERRRDDRKLQMRLQISYTHTSYMYISLVIRLATIVSTQISVIPFRNQTSTIINNCNNFDSIVANPNAILQISLDRNHKYACERI